MNKTSNHNNPYPFTASDIDKYRKGELSPGEMNALEQAALDDPFLADAMEGLLTNAPPQHAPTELHERLNARVKKNDRKKVLLIWRRLGIAAVIILLLGFGYNLFFTSGPKL